MALVVIAMLAACGGDATQGDPDVIVDLPAKPCRAGSNGCFCTPANGCLGGLTCEAGFCVPRACTRGAGGCACYANGTCDANDGVPMTCDANLCRPTVVPDDGALGGACDQNVPCSDGLICQQDRCDDPACPLGTLGCGCGAFGRCDDLDDLDVADVRCMGGRCMLGACDEGSLGCVCDGGACDGSLVCSNGLCRAGNGLTLVVDDPAAQACDVLLREGTQRVAEVRFDARIEGTELHRSPDLALSFFARAPEPIAGVAATLQLSAATAVAPVDRPTVVQARCYDGHGRPLQTPNVTLQ